MSKFLYNNKPHIYTSSEIANAVSVCWGVDDHLRNCQFVKLSDYEELLNEVTSLKEESVGTKVDEHVTVMNQRHMIDALNGVIEHMQKLLVKTMRWIPCSLFMPKTGEFVLTKGIAGLPEVRCFDAVTETDDYDGHEYMLYGWYKETEFDGDYEFRIDEEAVKYWMPLPQDPDESNASDSCAIKPVNDGAVDPYKDSSVDELKRDLINANFLLSDVHTEETRLRNKVSSLSFRNTWYNNSYGVPTHHDTIVATKDNQMYIVRRKGDVPHLDYIGQPMNVTYKIVPVEEPTQIQLDDVARWKVFEFPH